MRRKDKSSYVKKLRTRPSIRASLKASLYCGNPTSSNQRSTQEWSNLFNGVFNWSPDSRAATANCSFLRWRGWRTPISRSICCWVALDTWWPEADQERSPEQYWLSPRAPNQASTVSMSQLVKASLGLQRDRIYYIYWQHYNIYYYQFWESNSSVTQHCLNSNNNKYIFSLIKPLQEYFYAVGRSFSLSLCHHILVLITN